MGYTKKIVCLANSRKPAGRCVAGREVLENRYGGWIRPVSVRPSAEISLEERRYENGRQPHILDVIEIRMIAAVPRVHQTENHMIDAEFYWTKVGAITWADLAALVDTVAEQGFLACANGVYTLNNVYLCISLTEAYEGDGCCHKLVATKDAPLVHGVALGCADSPSAAFPSDPVQLRRSSVRPGDRGWWYSDS